MDIKKFALARTVSCQSDFALWNYHNELIEKLKGSSNPQEMRALITKVEEIDNEILNHYPGNFTLKSQIVQELRDLEWEDVRATYIESKRNMTESFFRDVKREMARSRNRIVGITGPTGSGKSAFAAKICEILDPTFAVDRIAFTLEDFAEQIAKMDTKQWLVWDEIGVSMDARVAMAKERRPVLHMLETFRILERNIVFTTPRLGFVDVNVRKLMHYHLDMVDYGIVDWMEYEFIPIEGKGRSKGKIHLEMPSAKLWAQYEAKKHPYVMSILKKAAEGDQYDDKTKEKVMKDKKTREKETKQLTDTAEKAYVALVKWIKETRVDRFTYGKFELFTHGTNEGKRLLAPLPKGIRNAVFERAKRDLSKGR